jgi:hypothetical protein
VVNNPLIGGYAIAIIKVAGVKRIELFQLVLETDSPALDMNSYV